MLEIRSQFLRGLWRPVVFGWRRGFIGLTLVLFILLQLVAEKVFFETYRS